ncbi:hypothetical protein V499_03018 [Pseudogymnoascus sp. VKM F-103]|nr:hypothetical protein V499_03018 [Pseudogymnoascus sp. VKM F-103]
MTPFSSYNADGNTTMAGYDVTIEEVPQEPFYDFVYQTELEKSRGIARSATSALELASLPTVHGDYLQRLIHNGKSLGEFKVSNTRTIAILGGSGEGKSSLINSLLHFPDIAKSGDIGAACTSVVTEYRPKTASHDAPITMEVEYLSTSEREELIKELLWSFRRMYLPNAEDDGIAESEYARMLRESGEAWSSLEAAFSHQRAFNKNFLMQDMSEAGLAVATAQLVQWSHELDWPAGADSGKWTSTADTADECYEKTSIFMQDQFWPFTKIIRVYIEAQILKAGIILADLPGLHDTNLARVKAAQDYLLRCDHIFVVARISRAITNESLKSSFFSVVSKHAALEWEESGGKGMKIAIICTNSEDINEKSARREFCGPNSRISEEVMANLDKDISKEKANGDRQLVKKLKLRQVLQRLLLINARNMHVKEGLQRAYSAEIPNGVLQIFCVSNTSYEKYSMKGDAEMVQGSGIPEVRRFCYTVTSHAHLLEANHFRNSKIPSFLNSALLVATKPAYQTMEAKIDRSIYFTLFEVKEEIKKGATGKMRPEKKVYRGGRSVQSLVPERWRPHDESPKREHFNPVLMEGIDLKLIDIEYQFSQVVEELAKSVQIICSKASEPNQSSYVVTEMTPAYRSAAQEFGIGTAARQRQKVQGRIEEGTLFSNISMAISKDIKAEVKASFCAVQKELDGIFDVTENDIRTVLAMEEQPDQKGDTTREDRERRKEGLACELQDLKRQHEEGLISTDSIQREITQITEAEEESFAL